MHISSNNICDDGVTSISECLAENNTIQELTLSWNSTITEVTTKIAEALAVNKSLHTLDLSSQHANDPVHFTMTLLAAMEHNHTLKRLVLPTSVIKDEAIVKSKLEKKGSRKLYADTLVLNIGIA